MMFSEEKQSHDFESLDVERFKSLSPSRLLKENDDLEPVQASTNYYEKMPEIANLQQQRQTKQGDQ